MRRAYVSGRVLLADGFTDGVMVLVDAGRIVALLDESEPLPPQTTVHDVGGALIAPGFIDVQVNGGGGVLLNDAPTVDGLRTIAAAHRRFGTTGLLPTLISDEWPVVEQALAATAEAIRLGIPGVLGLHLEGPVLAPSRRGIHDAAVFRALDDDAIQSLGQSTGGRTLLTVAAEQVTPAQIATLVERGVIVAIGHSDASAATTLAAFDAGATGVTHLYNAMAPLAARNPGVLAAALADPRPWCGLITDGHHVDPLALRIALAARPVGRNLIVTDAMSCVGTDARHFLLRGRPIEVRDGVCRGSDGTLAGSAADMLHCVRYAARHLGVPLSRVLRMASEYPADFLGLSASHGRIAPGYVADLIALDPALETVEVLG